MAEDAPVPAPRRAKASLRLNVRGWVYLALTLSVAFAAAFKGNNLLFAVFCVLFGLLGASGYLTWAVARKLEVSRILPETAVVGETFTLALRIRNAKKVWPAFCIRFEDRLTHEGRPATLQPTPVWLPYAKPGGRAKGTYYAAAHERGWARFGPYAVSSEFLTGLFTWRAVLGGEDKLLVVPRLGRLNRRLVGTLLARGETSPFSSPEADAGDEEFAGLREYRPGDHPRRIDWKMSARLPGGDLLVRELENPKVRDAVILLDTFLPNPGDARRRARLERAVSFAATLADHLLADQYLVTLRAFGPDPISLELEPRRGATDDLLVNLALLKPCRAHPVGDLVAAEECRSDRVYFVLKAGDDALPPWDGEARSVVVDASEMKALMHEPD
jgi:uncharacterized protein (DUF58 family)